jgi:hypothetical protein
MRSDLVVPGAPMQPQSTAFVVFCSDRFLETIGLHVVAGRSFSPVDVEQSGQVALVNETLAKRYFVGQNPIGRPIRLARLATLPVPVPDPTFEVIGVVTTRR